MLIKQKPKGDMRQGVAEVTGVFDSFTYLGIRYVTLEYGVGEVGRITISEEKFLLLFPGGIAVGKYLTFLCCCNDCNKFCFHYLMANESVCSTDVICRFIGVDDGLINEQN